MSIEWKYKIDLSDNAISTLTEKYGIYIPDDIVELLEKANAATPSKTKFMLKVDEKVLGAILSFNPGETEADSFESATQLLICFTIGNNILNYFIPFFVFCQAKWHNL